MRIVTAALLPAGIACTGEANPASRGDEWVAERDTVGDAVLVRTVRGSASGAPRRLVERVSVEPADGVRYVKRFEIERAPADAIGRD